MALSLSTLFVVLFPSFLKADTTPAPQRPDRPRALLPRYRIFPPTGTALIGSMLNKREQLSKRLAAAEERLPQQITMAYRHLLLLGEGDEGGTKFHIDLGPARGDWRSSTTGVEHLRH